MTNFGWSLVQLSAQLLRPEEREVVLGDLAEAQASAWESFTGVLGLAVRKQALLWKDWRPWFAGFGISLPGTTEHFMQIGQSVFALLAALVGGQISRRLYSKNRPAPQEIASSGGSVQ